jgi:hypothetical protein
VLGGGEVRVDLHAIDVGQLAFRDPGADLANEGDRRGR